MAHKKGSLQKAIDELAATCLGHNGVVGVYDDVRDGETVIVVVVTTVRRISGIPTASHGYRVLVEQGKRFTAEHPAKPKRIASREMGCPH